MLDETAEGDDIAPPDHPWKPDRTPSDIEVINRALASLALKPGRAILLTARTAREISRATRNPIMVAMANQVRDGLRGPLGAVLNFGRRRAEDRDPPVPLRLPTGGAPPT